LAFAALQQKIQLFICEEKIRHANLQKTNHFKKSVALKH